MPVGTWRKPPGGFIKINFDLMDARHHEE